MFIAIATSLATCQIANAVDMDGRPISKDVQYTPGTIRYVYSSNVELSCLC